MRKARGTDLHQTGVVVADESRIQIEESLREERSSEACQPGEPARDPITKTQPEGRKSNAPCGTAGLR